LAVLLCAALLAAVAVVPAGAEQACECGAVVQVYLDGFGCALFYDIGTPEQRQVGVSITDNLTADIFRLLGKVLLSLVTFNSKFAADGVVDLLMSLMGHLCMDEQGRSIEPITEIWRLDEGRDHTASPEYTFTYDWRIDPYDAADQLHEFVERLCEVTGHEKIALTGFSEGASVSLAYIERYGTVRLETLILANGAWQGVTLVGEMLNMKLAVTGTSLTAFLAGLPDESGRLAPSMNVVGSLHLLDFISPMIKFIVRKLGDRVYERGLIPLFGHMPAIWGFIPDEYYAESRHWLAGQEKYAYLLGKADAYHYNVQTQAARLLTQAQEDGVKLGIVCGYGYAAVPATQTQGYHTDSLIDTARASGGATVAPFGKTLPASSSPYRSPDGVIDAATCLYPDRTWFIKGMRHENGPSRAWRQWFIHSDGQATVFDDERFPQYMKAGE